MLPRELFPFLYSCVELCQKSAAGDERALALMRELHDRLDASDPSRRSTTPDGRNLPITDVLLAYLEKALDIAHSAGAKPAQLGGIVYGITGLDLSPAFLRGAVRAAGKTKRAGWAGRFIMQILMSGTPKKRTEPSASRYLRHLRRAIASMRPDVIQGHMREIRGNARCDSKVEVRLRFEPVERRARVESFTFEMTSPSVELRGKINAG